MSNNFYNNSATNEPFNPIALAMIRKTFPKMFANKVVGVQAMSTPVGLAFDEVFIEEI